MQGKKIESYMNAAADDAGASVHAFVCSMLLLHDVGCNALMSGYTNTLSFFLLSVCLSVYLSALSILLIDIPFQLELQRKCKRRHREFK